MIISSQNQGLCNRLKALLAAMRIDDDYRIHWKLRKFLNCPFNDLFKNDITIEKKFVDRATPVHRDSKEERFRITKKAIKTIKIKMYRHWQFPVFESDGIDGPVDFLYEKTPEVIKKAYLRLIPKLIPVDYVKNTVERYRPMVKELSVIHVRSNWGGGRREFDINRIFKFIEQEGQENVYITCDLQSTFNMIRGKYPKVKFARKRVALEDKNVKGIQDALVDVYLGGLGKKFYPTIGSFSELMWFFGECKAEICR